VIDLDRCSAGDAALDLGKLLADLRWWSAATCAGNADRAQQHFLEGYFGDGGPSRLLRGRVYEALLLLKIAAHRVPLFDARWQARIDALVSEAERALAGAERDPRLRRVGLRRGGVVRATSASR
jgi:hypothetical protein